jgi:hypothetical protein
MAVFWQQTPLNRWSVSFRLHGATSQKTTIFIKIFCLHNGTDKPSGRPGYIVLPRRSFFVVPLDAAIMVSHTWIRRQCTHLENSKTIAKIYPWQKCIVLLTWLFIYFWYRTSLWLKSHQNRSWTHCIWVPNWGDRSYFVTLQSGHPTLWQYWVS